MKIEKEDLVNQSQYSFILFIINSFDSLVVLSPSRAYNPSVMDCSSFKSHSSFIHTFILSNTTEWQSRNAVHPISILMRDGRLEILIFTSFFPIHPWIKMDLIFLAICSIWLISDIQSIDGWRDKKCSEGVISLFFVTVYSRASASIILHNNQSYLYNPFLLFYQMNLSIVHHP